MKNFKLLIVFLFMSAMASAQGVTYSNTVAGLIYKNCTSCHREGAIAPFKMQNFDDVYAYRNAIVESIKGGKMPPWSPNTSYTHFINEKALAQADIAKIEQWVKDGAPRGDISTEPKVPEFSNKSQIENPDFSKKTQSYTIPENTDDFHFFALESGLNENAFIKQIEFVPSNRKVVHHIFIYIDSTGSFKKSIDQSGGKLPGNNWGGNALSSVKLIGSWLPGGGSNSIKYDMGFRIPKNSYYIIQIHYAPNSKNQVDATTLNVAYSRSTARRNMKVAPLIDNTVNLVGGPLSIPANTVRTHTAKYRVTQDISLLSIMPHMHLLGKKMKVYAISPNSQGDIIPLIEDNWDFHWQEIYSFPKMIHLKAGTTIYAEATYDNTTANADNPSNPPKDVVAGTTTFSEMLQVFFCYDTYRKGDEEIDFFAEPLPFKSINISCTLLPNPVRSEDVVTLNINSTEAPDISLYSMDNKLIKTYKATDAIGKCNINLPPLSAGVYFFRIQNSHDAVTRKLIVN
ncbi:MAG: T9SS type A sorting domain-containing protein [Bacteroidetes bacterium]|nr:T9SS type A sorting domain-containing protein [Bacteroidota bacterium]